MNLTYSRKVLNKWHNPNSYHFSIIESLSHKMCRKYLSTFLLITFFLAPKTIVAEADEKLRQLELESEKKVEFEAYLRRLILMMESNMEQRLDDKFAQLQGNLESQHNQRKDDLELLLNDKFAQIQANLESKMDGILYVIETHQRHVEDLDEKLTKIMSSMVTPPTTERSGGTGVTSAPPMTPTPSSVTPTTQPTNCSQNDSGMLIWKIDHIAAQLRGRKERPGFGILYSCPFYTRPGGYKLQAQLLVNGYATAQYLSIYYQILPSQFDTTLKWPFPHTMSFTLYDQGSYGHEMLNVIAKVSPNKWWKSHERPGPLFVFTKGYEQLISQATLKTRNYIKDDTIILKIKVEP